MNAKKEREGGRARERSEVYKTNEINMMKK
jgi:hypothetical protein